MEPAVVVVAGVQGDDAEVVASHEVPVLLQVVQYEGEDPVQTIQEVASVLRVQGKDDLAVASGEEPIGASELGLELAVVVDLAVDGQDVGAVGVLQRLGAVFHIHDGEAVVGQDGALVSENAGPVGAAVSLQLR